MGKMPDRDFAERLNGLTRRNLILLAKNMTDISSEANPNNDHLTWFANTVELFQFEGHEGFRLQGYHIPSIFTKPIDADFEKPILDLPVIVHMAGLSEATLKHVKLLRELSCRGYEIFSLDIRGQGFSGETGNNGGPIVHAKSFSYFVSDLEIFIRKRVRPSITAATKQSAREASILLALSLEGSTMSPPTDTGKTTTVTGEEGDEGTDDGHTWKSKNTTSIEMGTARRRLFTERQSLLSTDNRRHSCRVLYPVSSLVTPLVITPYRPDSVKAVDDFGLILPSLTGGSRSLPGTPTNDSRLRSLMSDEGTPINNRRESQMSRYDFEETIGRRPIVFIGNAVAALIGLTLHSERPGLMQKVVCISPCLRPLMDSGLRLLIAPMRFCGMGSMLLKRENNGKGKAGDGRNGVSKESTMYWDELCDVCPSNLKIQGSSIALTREILRAANTMEKVGHTLSGGILLLQAKSDTVVDNDASDSFFNNLKPSCKALSTFRTIKNSHHDLLFGKEEVFGELIEEINYFLLP